MMIVSLMFLAGCNGSKEAIKGQVDLKGLVKEVNSDGNRILIDDEEAGLVWVSLPDHGKIDRYSVGEEVVVWITGGIDTSLPAQARALNIEIVK